MNLKQYRDAAGFTQRDLGELLGVTATTVSRWERGEREPSFDYLLQLSDLFGVTVDALLRKESEAANDDPTCETASKAGAQTPAES
ncbi:MAG: helix-turn-helix transcriptional regulator [Clostridia bacterium]